MPAQFRYHLLVKYLTLAAIVLSAALTSAQTIQPATLVLRNGKIVTVDAAIPEAQAIAIRGDRIEAVGTNDSIQRYIGPATQVIDLRGQLAIPGLIESHGHFMGLGQSKMTLDLMDVKNWDEIVSMVAAAAKQAQPGEWIVGRGWHQEKWSSVPKPNVEGFPFHDALSKVSPNNPVMLTHASGHASFVNAKAMELSNITAATPESVGRRDPEGPGRAADWPAARDRLGPGGPRARRLAREEDRRRARSGCAPPGRACRQGSARGRRHQLSRRRRRTSTPSTSCKQVAAEGKLGIRLWVMVRDSNDNLRAKMPQYKAVGLNDNHLTIAAIKVVADGALGSRGAWLLAPYADSAVERRPADQLAREHRRDGADRRRQRRAAVRARDRRSRQSRDAERLRARCSRRVPT